MARLAWGLPGEKFYETGVDRGVLYVTPDEGVAWNGLISVAENPTGGEARPTYLDGLKVRNFASYEEFEATIDTFSVPKEFRPCDGVKPIQNGLLLTQQPRRPFNFSYRTMVGNDVSDEHAYKIHLVYNALAGPSSISNTTTSDSTEATTLSWGVTTRPPIVSGIRPTAHLVVDTRDTPAPLVVTLEEILYGNDEVGSHLPSVSELITMFESYV